MVLTTSRFLSLIVLAVTLLAGGFLLLPGVQEGASAFAAIISVELMLPLIGIAAVLGQLPRGQRLWTVLALVLGAGAGLQFRETLYSLMAQVPGAAAHLFLTGPIACALTGFVLILPPKRRNWIAPVLLAPTAAAIAIATRLGDPAVFAQHYLASAFALQACVVGTVAWPAAKFANPALHTAARILGSWMLAVALLYGGAFVAGKEAGLTPPPFPPIPVEASVNGSADGSEALTEPAP
jgi:GNAT superfamily N-acetyltransferase